MTLFSRYDPENPIPEHGARMSNFHKWVNVPGNRLQITVEGGDIDYDLAGDLEDLPALLYAVDVLLYPISSVTLISEAPSLEQVNVQYFKDNFPKWKAQQTQEETS